MSLPAARRTPAVAARVGRAGALRGWLLAGAAFLPVVLLRAGDLAEADTFWQVRTGEWILDHGRIPQVDIYSWTARGEPWQMNSWGWNVVVGLAYRAGGLPLVALTGAAVVLGVVALVILLARRLGARPFPTGVLLVLSSPLLIEWLSARPQLVDYAAVLGLVLLLHAAVTGRPRLRGLAAVALLGVVWANLHAGVLLGVGLAAASTVAVAVRPATRSRTPWFAAATGLLAVASLLNPYGLEVVSQTWSVRSAAVDLAEWQPLNPLDAVHVLPVLAGLVALVVLLRRRLLVPAACLAVLLAGSVAAIRFVPMALLVAVAALAPLAERGPIARYLCSRWTVLRAAAAIGMAAYAVVAAPNLLHLGRPDPAKYSSAVVRAIPPGCRLFNSYDLGGFVILERPDVAVSIDSRAELYGSAAIRRYAAVVNGAADPTAALAPAGCVLLPPETALARRLAADPAWRSVAGDGTAVLLRRS